MESRMCEFVNTYDENEHFESTSFLNKSKRHARSHSLGEVDGATLRCPSYPLWRDD